MMAQNSNEIDEARPVRAGLRNVAAQNTNNLIRRSQSSISSVASTSSKSNNNRKDLDPLPPVWAVKASPLCWTANSVENEISYRRQSLTLSDSDSSSKTNPLKISHKTSSSGLIDHIDGYKTSRHDSVSPTRKKQLSSSLKSSSSHSQKPSSEVSSRKTSQSSFDIAGYEMTQKPKLTKAKTIDSLELKSTSKESSKTSPRKASKRSSPKRNTIENVKEVQTDRQEVHSKSEKRTKSPTRSKSPHSSSSVPETAVPSRAKELTLKKRKRTLPSGIHFLELPHEIIWKSLVFLSAPDLLNLCMTCHFFRDFLSSGNIWHDVSVYHFGKRVESIFHFTKDLRIWKEPILSSKWRDYAISLFLSHRHSQLGMTSAIRVRQGCRIDVFEIIKNENSPKFPGIFLSGVVEMKAHLEQNSILLFGWNDPIIESAHSFAAGLADHFDDITFHSSVNISIFKATRAITFLPPNFLTFQLMRYRVNDFNPPILSNVEVKIDNKNQFSILGKIWASSNWTIQDFSLQLPLPIDTIRSIKLKSKSGSLKHVCLPSEIAIKNHQTVFESKDVEPRASSSHQTSFDLDARHRPLAEEHDLLAFPNDQDQYLIWKMSRVEAGYHRFRATFEMASDPSQWKRKPATLKYYISNGSLVNFKVRFVKKISSVNVPSNLPHSIIPCFTRRMIYADLIYNEWPKEFIDPKAVFR